VNRQVCGIDLSLRATGIAHCNGVVEVFTPTHDGASNAGMDRLCEIRDHVIEAVVVDTELAIIEALAFDAHDTNRWGAQLAGIVRAGLYDQEVPFLLVVPGTLKKYATGNGRAGKDQMTNAAQKRLKYEGYDNNEADALWLRAIGLDLLGDPVVELPKANREAITLLRQRRPVVRP
jgi:Holliday junction resolvasome RuvABC endonuclease subunit